MIHVLGIDLGTSSLKAVLLRQDGAPAGAVARPYPIQAPQPGWAEQDPEDWWRACRDAVAALLAESGVEAGSVQAICAGGQMHGAVLLDGHHRPLRPAIIWPDQRAAAEAAQTEAMLDACALLPRLGGGVAAGFMVATLAWCRTHEPALWQRTVTALLPKDYLRYRLTGELAAEPSDASGAPLLDLPTWRWSSEALAALDLPEALLPPIRRSDEVAGALTPEAASAFGLPAGIPVLSGGSDQAMAAIGAGLLEPGTLLISLSTGGQIVTPLLAPLTAPVHGLRTICSALHGTYLALSATLGAGLSLRWLREQALAGCGPGTDTALLELASGAPPGAAGLLFLPYLAGERAPLLDAAASGALIGLRLDHTQAHLIRAVLEGIAFSLRHALEPLLAAGVRADRVMLAGGLAQAPLMRAIMAGVLGQPVIPMETVEQSALGAALLAARHAGFFTDLPAACAVTVQYAPPVMPDPADVVRYDQLFARYRGLYPKLREDMHALRRIGA